MKTANTNTIELDLSTPEKLDSFADRLDRARRLQPEQLMNFSNFVREFQRNDESARLRGKK